jgi:beta-lactamase superfamily II metal-dependent hydrolase
VSNPDADHIGGFLDVFDAFPVQTVVVSGDPNSTLTYSTFLRGVRDEGAKTEVLRAGMLMDWGGVKRTHETRNIQSSGLRFRALLTENGDQNVRICGA